MNRDKGSLSEQQRKRTVTTMILIRRIHKTNSGMHRATLTAQCPSFPRAMINFLTPLPPLPWVAPPLRTKHDITWH